jgi:hypothetical protein
MHLKEADIQKKRLPFSIAQKSSPSQPALAPEGAGYNSDSFGAGQPTGTCIWGKFLTVSTSRPGRRPSPPPGPACSSNTSLSAGKLTEQCFNTRQTTGNWPHFKAGDIGER